MKKIKLLLLALLVVVSGSFLKAQEMTFEQMIPVRVLMPVNNDIKGDALTILYNRLNQAVSLNGLGSSTNESRFLIVTSITVVSKSATPTIPVQYMAELEVSFYFVDNIKKIILPFRDYYHQNRHGRQREQGCCQGYQVDSSSRP